MKPNVFIGSSSENLALANAIQENLEFDGNITVWNQGIFKLSSTALDDLIKALDHFDFAIFVFKPDDMIHMRGDSYNVVRDNVIFELGLFIGKLGKNRVFYLTPRSVEKLHLPTDLLGHTYGVYDDKREDRNLNAAIGIFCNQVRKELQEFIYVNLSDFANETESAKKIVIGRSKYWEFELAVELLNSKLVEINQSAEELAADRIIQHKTNMDQEQLREFVQTSLSTVIGMAEQFQKVLVELTVSFGPAGSPGNAHDIKKAVDRLVQIAKELLIWEYQLNAIIPPENLKKVKQLMKGWSSVFIDQFNTLAPQLQEMIDEAKSKGSCHRKINLVLESPAGMQEITEIFKRLYS